jgi:hypothetical protein
MKEVKLLKLILTYVIFISIVSCNNLKKNEMDIEPIDKEFNDRLKFGVQYYEISNYKDYDFEELSTLIKEYLLKNDKEIKNEGMILFYKKSIFANYSKNMYESARDNEFGNIEGYDEYLVVKVWYDINESNKKQYIIVYNKDSVVYEITNVLQK